MLPLPLTMSWCALVFTDKTWSAGSFDGFLIVVHVLRLLCVILVDVMTSSNLLFFFSVILLISLFPDSKVPRQKGCLNSSSCMLHIDFLVGQLDLERILFDIFLVCVV